MLKAITFALVTALASAEVDENDFSSADYLALPRQEKADRIWAKVIEDRTTKPYPKREKLWSVKLKPAFYTVGDTLPCNESGCKEKITHPIGDVAKCEWVNVGGHPYTGLFLGSDTAFVRLSENAKTITKPPMMSPSIAVKFLRDGADSHNIFAAHTYGLDWGPGLNFFETDFTTILRPPKVPAIQKFAVRGTEVTPYVFTSGLAGMAEKDQYGNIEEDVQFPFELIFEPTADVQFSDDTTSDVPFLSYLERIPEGTTMMSVFALDKPTELGGTKTHIADLVLRSFLTRSRWGDERMYFRHYRKELDFDYYPEWKPYYDCLGPQCANPVIELAQVGSEPMEEVELAQTGCPFAALFEDLLW